MSNSKGKEKIEADQEQAGDPRGGSNYYLSFLDDDEYFEDPYVDGTSNFLVGSRFQPTDQELVGFYLRRKATNNLPRSHDFIPLFQLYVPGAEPWLLHPGMASSSSSAAARNGFFLPCNTTDWFFCFSYTTPRGPGSSRTVGSGSWVSNGTEQIYGSRKQILGHKSTFSFKIMSVDGGKRGVVVSTNWVMHEFRLHYRDNNISKKLRGSRSGPVDSDAHKELVLCRIRCTKSMAVPQEPQMVGEYGSSATGRKRIKWTTTAAAAALISDGSKHSMTNSEHPSFSVPEPPSAGSSVDSSDSI